MEINRSQKLTAKKESTTPSSEKSVTTSSAISKVANEALESRKKTSKKEPATFIELKDQESPSLTPSQRSSETSRTTTTTNTATYSQERLKSSASSKKQPFGVPHLTESKAAPLKFLPSLETSKKSSYFVKMKSLGKITPVKNKPFTIPSQFSDDNSPSLAPPHSSSSHKKSTKAKSSLFNKKIKASHPSALRLSFNDAATIIKNITLQYGTSIDFSLSQADIIKQLILSLKSYLKNELITENFIHEVSKALVSEDLSSSVLAANANPNPYIDPHPFQVIESLSLCLSRLPSGLSFLEIMKESAKYMQKAREDYETLFPISEFLETAPSEKIQKVIQEGPLYTAFDWFECSNANPTFMILGNKNVTPEWVFKPAIDNSQDASSEANDLKDFEHYAFQMNYHQKFPIPAVYLIEIRGVKGVIQPFIPGAVPLQKIEDDLYPSLTNSLQKLLVFDLLFANQDRSGSNILFLKKDDQYTAYGIDHEHCMHNSKGFLNIGYLESIEDLCESASFSTADEEIQVLFSEECCNRYVQILQECFKDKNNLGSKDDIDQEKICDWITDIGKMLRTSNKTMTELASEIKEKYEEGNSLDEEESYLND
ncbi:hypothetical protein [Rhabdochlamydiaceae symbiont of Dictyostelium giganteum]|uniref:hypothetical protein n=1 Tax=Rhabdochlamydiaceae symbiont of Dictyostelium giganteum TaxID=3342349 RepID=UPI003850511C